MFYYIGFLWEGKSLLFIMKILAYCENLKNIEKGRKSP